MHTVLYEEHKSLGGKMVDFSGWDMPLHYSKGIVEEHLAVRNRVGIFDVSHMGCVKVLGKDATSFLNYVSTNEIAAKKDNTATYTVWCSESGGSVDDVIIFKRSSEDFFVVVNASNRKKDLQHLEALAESWGNVEIQPRFDEDGIIAVQGPSSEALLKDIFPNLESIRPMRFVDLNYKGVSIVLSRTGYTGSLGFELYASNPIIVDLWKELLEKGKEYSVTPVGLGARDSLRLEMGYALYSHELSDSITPLESVSKWTVKKEKENFLGKQALMEVESSTDKRCPLALVLEGRAVPRAGFAVESEGEKIGSITSGGYSPCLKKGIALALCEHDLANNTEVNVIIREKRVQAKVVNLPFITL